MDHEGRVAARAEAVLLSKLAHPSILHHHESFEDLVATDEGPARRTLCIVTEFCDRGDLTSQIQQRKGSHFPESEVLEILAQICLALSYIHSRKVLHRDLKPQNVFVSRDGSIRLGDFGIARVLRHTFELAKTVVGTPIYLAPEVVESKPYGARADVWSLGVVLYEVMALRRPFSGSTIPSLVRRILRGKYAPLPSHYSEELRGLAHLMLSKSPGSRPSVAAVLQLPMMRPAVEKFIGHCRAKRAGIAPEVLPRELRFLLEAPGHRDEDDGDGVPAAGFVAAAAAAAAASAAARIPEERGDGRAGYDPARYAMASAAEPSAAPERDSARAAADGGGGANLPPRQSSPPAPPMARAPDAGRGRAMSDVDLGSGSRQHHAAAREVSKKPSPARPAAGREGKAADRARKAARGVLLKRATSSSEADDPSADADASPAAAFKRVAGTPKGSGQTRTPERRGAGAAGDSTIADFAKQAISQQQRHDESASGSDPDDVAEVAHIRVSGSTIDLTGAARDGPPLLRLEALRQYLADQLGQTDFLKLYASLKEDGGEGRRGPSALDDAWAADLGSTLRHHFRDRPERFSYIPVVEQLLRLEEAHFCEGD
ncbi:Nek1 [Symbiodinium sp. KB8]|nr:Nek1 [Symbiodinium sp. KB8]